MNKNNVCYKCECRYPNCHSECLSYLCESEKRQQRKKEINKNKKKDIDFDDYLKKKRRTKRQIERYNKNK